VIAFYLRNKVGEGYGEKCIKISTCRRNETIIDPELQVYGTKDCSSFLLRCEGLYLTDLNLIFQRALFKV
jgi:hypothetical protein